jgi:hypothetical protein
MLYSKAFKDKPAWLNAEIRIITFRHRASFGHLIKFYLSVEIVFDPCYREILHFSFIVSQDLILIFSQKYNKSLKGPALELR